MIKKVEMKVTVDVPDAYEALFCTHY